MFYFIDNVFLKKLIPLDFNLFWQHTHKSINIYGKKITITLYSKNQNTRNIFYFLLKKKIFFVFSEKIKFTGLTLGLKIPSKKQKSKKSLISLSPHHVFCMASFFRARRVGITAATLTVAVTGSYVALRDPFISINDRNGSGSSPLETIRRKITDPVAIVPSRAVQQSSLIGANSNNPLDILVVGGGATGCGVALDAVTRGLRVGLVERDDFSSGTSSRSTKLIHGGMHFCLL